MSTSRILLAAMIGSSVLQAACGGPTGPGSEDVLPLDPGIELVRDGVQDFAWSGDGTEVYYETYSSIVGGPQTRLMAKPVVSASSPERVLVDGGGQPFNGMATSPNGAWLYYLQWPSDSTATGYSLYRVATAGGAPQLVDTDVSPGSDFGPPAGAGFVISPGGDRLAFTREHFVDSLVDSIVVLDPEAGAERSLPSHLSAETVAFSPDGRRLLYFDCITVDDCGLSIVDVASGAVEPGPYHVQGGISGLNKLLGARWDEDGIRLVIQRWPDVALQDASTGTETKLAMGGSVGFTPSASFGGWSPDGGPAAWKTGCLQALSLFTCGESRAALYLFDRSGHNPRLLAVNGDRGSAEFSPDGRRVAYLAGVELFVHDVP